MATPLRFSWAAHLLPVVLSAAGTMLSAGTAQAADATPATRPSCASIILEPGAGEESAGFGAAVTVHDQTAVVGIPQYSSASVSGATAPYYFIGRAAVFTCEASTQAWTRTATLEVPLADGESQFGISAATQDDLVAIGANYSVRVFQKEGQNWSQIVKIVPKNTQEGIIGTPAEQWGTVIAFDHDVLAVGVTEITSSAGTAGSGYVTSNKYYVDLYQILACEGQGFATRIARLKPPVGDTGTFGAALALKDDTLVVGDPPDVSAYVYKRRGFTFTLDQKLTGAEATAASAFGSAVAVANDVILIGAPAENPVTVNYQLASEGAVYAYRHKSGSDSRWDEIQHFMPATLGYTQYAGFGATVAVNEKGQAVIGTPQSIDFLGPTFQYGPTFSYTLQRDQFVLTSPPAQFLVTTPATDLGITDEYLISGNLGYIFGQLSSGAFITNTDTLPTN